MPPKAPHPCAYPRCPNLTTERYCSVHKTVASREYNQSNRPTDRKLYGRQWVAIRNRYIQKHPLCELCLEAGRYVPADEVHLQKTVGVDFLQKSRKKNEGEAPQYHVKGSHEAIIRPEVFDLVQAELHKQKRSGKTRTCTHTFSSQIICGECGGTFGAKKWRTTTGGERLQRMIWQCNEKYRVKGKINCHTPHLTDNQLEYAFVTAFNLILRQKEQYISDYEPIIEMLTDVSALEKETATLREQQDELYTLVKNCIDEKARRGNDPALATQHKKLIGRYDAVKARLDDIASEIASRSVKNTKIKNFLEELQAQGDILTGFDETLWKRTADRIIVHRESDIVVEFKDGRQIRVSVLGK